MKHSILIDLDVLLDTRIATMFNIDIAEAIRILNEGYLSRKTDDMDGVSNIITNDIFTKAYAARNIETLKTARLTNYIFELANVVSNLAKAIDNDDTRVEDPCIVINYYPYKDLDEDTLKDIVYAVGSYTTDALEIRVAYYKPDELDLNFLKEAEILTYITYDFKTWFESNFNIKKGKKAIISYPKFTIISPQIMPKMDSFDNLNGEAQKVLQNRTPFDFMKLYWAPMFGIEYCPIELMSLIDTNIIETNEDY